MPTDSFSDIAFLLIIFFILVTSLSKDQGFITDMPRSEQSDEKPKKTNTVVIKNEKVYFNDKELTIEGLAKALKKLKLADKAADEDKLVMMEPAGNIKYQLYFEVMSTISTSGGVIALVKEDEDNGKGDNKAKAK